MIPLIPAAVTVAIPRYQLLDIRLVFSRSLAYAIVTGVLPKRGDDSGAAAGSI